MTIAQIGPFPLDVNCIKGGIESSVFGLAGALAESQRVEVFDFPRQDGREETQMVRGMVVHRYCNTGRHNEDAASRCDKMVGDILSIQPDVCHIHGSGLMSKCLFDALRERGIRPVLTVHGLAHIEKWKLLKHSPSLKHLYQYWRQSKTEFGLLGEAEWVIVDTEYVRKEIEGYFKKRKISSLPEMAVIPQGIDPVYFDLPRPEWNRNILSVGAFSRRKGHLLLIQAFEKLCERMPDAHLDIAGIVAEPDYYAAVLAYLKESPRKDRISLHTDLSQEALQGLFQQSCVFALHSKEESQGIALVEAMAAGLPVVATKVGGIPYVVHHRRDGLLSEYGDIDSFCSSLFNLLSDPGLWSAFSTRAQSSALDYSWQKIAERILQEYTR